MEEFLTLILKNIVNNPDEVRVEMTSDEKGKVALVYVADEDKPLVIGRGGSNIKSIRNLASIISKREGESIFVKLVD